jgi:branched-chain amino acid transport system ATP-binding protein
MGLLVIQNLVKRFGGLCATDDFSLDVQEGEVHALIGPNGAGKTTLINQLTGILMPDSGRVEFNGEDVTYMPTHRRALAGMARSYQITAVFLELTVLENVSLAVQATQGHSFRFWRPILRDHSLVEPALALIDQVGLHDFANARVSELAHGARRQLELGMTLASSPRLLLLDEPMAGMSKHDSLEMLALLGQLKGKYTIVLIEHDMDAVFALADRVTVMVAGHVIETGTPDQIRSSESVRAAYLGGEEEFTL